MALKNSRVEIHYYYDLRDNFEKENVYLLSQFQEHVCHSFIPSLILILRGRDYTAQTWLILPLEKSDLNELRIAGRSKEAARCTHVASVCMPANLKDSMKEGSLIGSPWVLFL